MLRWDAVMPVEEHRSLWRGVRVKFCLIVTSDSIFEGLKNDEITPMVKKLVEGAGHELLISKVVPNDSEALSREVEGCLRHCDSILITGGTGISRKDVSADSVLTFCSKHIPGYGELFRYLTYLKFGSAAILSRSYACVAGNSVIFLTPGSPQAVELALTKLILPEIRHLMGELRK
ncbi:MAG: molybdenum cofactor biosynthesis protein B [Sulfolobales archaeon]|nr:molybdenum cofactor biosynthesis protein MoaB [Sulfolobales archaeon]MDW7968852.1 molybdenum cofactor biosynthesis protein B [Sulfolobales archaeon]